MARRSFTGLGRIYWVPTVADPAAPTTAEIEAGTELTSSVKRDGLDIPRSAETIDISDAGSRVNKSAPGTIGGDAVTITAWRDSDPTLDIAWATLVDDATGYLVVNRWGNKQDEKSGLGTGAEAVKTVAPAAGDRVEVYECTVTSRAMDAIGTDANSATITLTQGGIPQLDAAVAEGGGGKPPEGETVTERMGEEV
ncbi:phage tail tube protein [Streptomyces celluloflavus]|uniref:phage tail tube protein n=1 Tax=Streptomyces celluloflavus TaxID=58344 RepID=UPI0036957334